MEYSLNAKLPLAFILAAALAGCATTCPQPTVSAPQALTNRLYSLRGTVVSALALGKITGQQALALNAQLNTAQSDLQLGTPTAITEATVEMDGVQAVIMTEEKP